MQVFCLVQEMQLLGFMAVAADKIEMLFLEPACIGLGLGKKLIGFAVTQLGVREVDVNEQNYPAVAFYRKCGFVLHHRSAQDGAGKPYPILHMQLGH
jgi:putative acetyltransferase